MLFYIPAVSALLGVNAVIFLYSKYCTNKILRNLKDQSELNNQENSSNKNKKDDNSSENNPNKFSISAEEIAEKVANKIEKNNFQKEKIQDFEESIEVKKYNNFQLITKLLKLFKKDIYQFLVLAKLLNEKYEIYSSSEFEDVVDKLCYYRYKSIEAIFNDFINKRSFAMSEYKASHFTYRLVISLNKYMGNTKELNRDSININLSNWIEQNRHVFNSFAEVSDKDMLNLQDELLDSLCVISFMEYFVSKIVL